MRDVYQAELRYQKSGSFAEQALSSIKVVKAFGQENKEVQIYNEQLDKQKHSGKFQAVLLGFSVGVLEIVVYLLTLFCLLVGSLFVIERVYNDNPGRDYTMGDVFG